MWLDTATIRVPWQWQWRLQRVFERSVLPGAADERLPRKVRCAPGREARTTRVPKQEQTQFGPGLDRADQETTAPRRHGTVWQLRSFAHSGKRRRGPASDRNVRRLSES